MTKPLHRDEALGHWVADGADAVAEVLTHAACRVRPVSEPVPPALLGTPAGEIFGELARMNDGSRHASRRLTIERLLAGLDEARVTEVAERCAARLAPGREPADFAHALPVRVVAILLGVREESLDEVTELMGRFVRCVFPGGTPEQVERGTAAAGRLLQLSDIAEIGVMAQSYDATAALILGRDPPVPATRRFLAGPAVIAGQALREGEMVLVKLDAAPFGAGPHVCPGRSIALTIARVARRYLR
jgi:cytochrome P450